MKPSANPQCRLNAANEMKIRIYYRHIKSNRLLPKIRPDWFTHEICFVNLLNTINSAPTDVEIELNIVFDGSQDELESDFSYEFLNSSLPIFTTKNKSIGVILISGGTQKAAWRRALEIAKTDCLTGGGDDLIYLLENDYLHQADWVKTIADLATSKFAWDYVSLYDHLDKYPEKSNHKDAAKYSHLQSKVFVSESRHWRTIPSTCASFIVRQKTFERDYPLLHYGLNDRYIFPILRRVRGRQLISAIPSLATHCMKDLLAPCIDWSDIARQTLRAQPMNSE